MPKSFASILPKNTLPRGWEEVSRQETANQVVIRLGHINPENKADPMLTSGNPSQAINGEAYTVQGISPRGTMTKFFEGMTAMAATGWMQGYTPAKVQKLRGQFNKMQDEKYDATLDVSVVRFPDAKAADQALQNQINLPTKGLGGMMIPGMDGKLVNIYDHPAIKKQMTKEQQTLMHEMLAKAQPQIAADYAKSGIKYSLGKYQGYPAAFSEMANPDYARFMAPKPKAPKKDPHAFVGGGYHPLAGKGILPQAPPPAPPPKIFKTYVGLQVGNYLISGGLLGGVEMLPPGNTYCEGLTKHKVHIEKETVEGHTYTNRYIVPVASTIASEGYLNREEVVDMLSAVIKSLK